LGAFVAGREFDMLFSSAHGDTPGDNPFQALGFPPAQVERYQGWARGGGVVIYVFCETEDQVHHAIEVLEEAGAEEVSQMDTQLPQLKSTTLPILKMSWAYCRCNSNAVGWSRPGEKVRVDGAKKTGLKREKPARRLRIIPFKTPGQWAGKTGFGSDSGSVNDYLSSSSLFLL
jgi:hypothetical protein